MYLNIYIDPFDSNSSIELKLLNSENNLKYTLFSCNVHEMCKVFIDVEIIDTYYH